MFDSGVRRSEVPKINKQQFIDAMDFDRKSLIVDEYTVQINSVYKPFFVDGVKGRRRETKPRHTVVSDIVLLRVKRYHSSPLYRKSSRKFGKNAPAFLNAEGNSYTASAISKLYERLSKRALKYGYITRAIHPHMMRHAFAGSVLRSPDLGSDAIERLMTVQVCLGHAHLSTTQIYTSLPYDIYGTLCSDDGEVLTRAEIMERVYRRTKLTIAMKDRK
jgi:integrase/recombinase XerC